MAWRGSGHHARVADICSGLNTILFDSWAWHAIRVDLQDMQLLPCPTSLGVLRAATLEVGNVVRVCDTQSRKFRKSSVPCRRALLNEAV